MGTFLRVSIKAAMILCIVFALGSYLVYLKTGRFWVPSFSTPNISMPFSGKPILDKKPTGTPVTKPNSPSYKWIEGGRWHYGEKPPKGVDAIRLDKVEK